MQTSVSWIPMHQADNNSQQGFLARPAFRSQLPPSKGQMLQARYGSAGMNYNSCMMQAATALLLTSRVSTCTTDPKQRTTQMYNATTVSRQLSARDTPREALLIASNFHLKFKTATQPVKHKSLAAMCGRNGEYCLQAGAHENRKQQPGPEVASFMRSQGL